MISNPTPDSFNNMNEAYRLQAGLLKAGYEAGRLYKHEYELALWRIERKVADAQIWESRALRSSRANLPKASRLHTYTKHRTFAAFEWGLPSLDLTSLFTANEPQLCEDETFANAEALISTPDVKGLQKSEVSEYDANVLTRTSCSLAYY